MIKESVWEGMMTKIDEIMARQVVAKEIAEEMVSRGGALGSADLQRITDVDDLLAEIKRASSLHLFERDALCEETDHLRSRVKVLEDFIARVGDYNDGCGA